MPNEEIITLTAEIVAAHVSNNTVSTGDIATLVQSVHSALQSLESENAVPPGEPREPAVSIRSSVKPDTIICLICGSKNKMIKRHLGTAHNITPAEYREEFGLKPDYPMVAPNHAKVRSDLAKKIGLGTKGLQARQAGSGKAAKA